jgi:DNA adenine methylase
VYAFWRAVLDRPADLCDQILIARLDMDEWKRQRAIQDEVEPDDLELAFSTFYLNRTSRSGIIGGGPIGGYDQRGTWGIDARFNKEDLVRRIKRIARFKTRITVTGLDAAMYLREELPKLDHQTSFVYLDPPYFVKGVKSAGLYQNFYQADDHQEIATLVAGLRQPWIVSYDATPEIDMLYGDYTNLCYDINYSAHMKYYGSERMYFSPAVTVPDVASPANIAAAVVDECRLAG